MSENYVPPFTMTEEIMYSVKDLLKAHKLMTEDLVKEAGTFRSKNAGVYDQNHNLIHAGSPANYVPDLISIKCSRRVPYLWHLC